MSLADSATDESDHELAWSQLAREEHALREVEDAIRRLAAGTYGVCEESGRPIPEERLRAVPWARFTKDVQERREREGLDRREVIPPLASIQEPGVAVMEGAEDPETDELIAREVERRQREEDVAALGRGADAAADGERTRKEPI